MSGPSEPSRLREVRDPAFADFEDGLSQLRASGPSAEQRMRMSRALGLPAPAGRGEVRSADGARGASRVSTWLKVLVGSVLGLAAIGAFVVLRPQRAPERAAPYASPSERGRPATPVVRPVEPAAQRPSSLSDSATSTRSGRTPAAHDRSLAVPAPSTSAGSLTEELTLLRRAKAHAVSEPDRALELLDEHARRFSHGALTQEREVIAVEALLARGDRGGAERRAARFLALNPGSAHARRVHALLGEPAPDAADSVAKPDAPAHPSW